MTVIVKKSIIHMGESTHCAMMASTGTHDAGKALHSLSEAAGPADTAHRGAAFRRGEKEPIELGGRSYA